MCRDIGSPSLRLKHYKAILEGAVEKERMMQRYCFVD